ncbi:hypothetical protein HU200_064242 [Digitaria exilis]|uniref:AAA+ ATPase domain-containing protein n=1 Tax=Digitaria exilis TaxID=1010633 RepID=A0A835A0B1_9POAL|nr:hypothetical protein HU200_064242 [Digitaria exilis]
MEIAVSAARWVLGKALGPVTDGLLEAWAASAGLGPNMDALKLELLCAKGMLDNAQGREIRSPALKELLLKLQQLAYGADDVLDELEYYRIQDMLDGTYHAADVDGLVLNARHAARAVARKLKLCSGSREGSRRDPDELEDDGRQGCLSGICSCGRRAISSMPKLPCIQSNENGSCMSKITSSTRRAAHNVGKCLPGCSFPCVHNNAHSSMPGDGLERFCSACRSKIKERKHVVQTPKLKFDRVEISKRMKDIVEKLKPVSAKVSTILDKELLGSAIHKLEVLGSNCTTTQNNTMERPKTTPDIIEPKLYGRDNQKKNLIDGITHGQYFSNDLVVLPIVGPGGIGKTTFTQHLYDELKNHFEVAIWICVSLSFNVSRLAQEAVKKIPKVDGEKENSSDHELIEQRLKTKRFLLVLDDMWTCQENEWKKLLAPFGKGGEKGDEKDGGTPCYVVHDLLHNLAVKVSSYECISIYSSNVRSIQIPTSIRHMSIIVDDKEVENRVDFENFKRELRELGKRLNVENLRTLMLFGRHHGSYYKILGHLFREARALRAIYLSGASYNVGDMLHDFSKLVHLRYLRIKSSKDSNDDICLPTALPRLYHLEVIDLQEWRGCFGFTRHMSNLVKLRHFLVPEHNLQVHSDIIEVGKMKLLQELRSFEVGKEDKGFDLSQLGQLSELGGSFTICSLEKMQAMKEADEAILIQLKRLNKLTLQWGTSQAEKENALEILMPHSNLQHLCIRGHGGTKCPQWLREKLSVKILESLHLDGVAWNTFPPIGELLLADEPHQEISSLDHLICGKIYESKYCLDIKGKLDLDSTFWNVLAFGNLIALENLDVSRCPPLPVHHFRMLSSLKTLNLWYSSSIVFSSSEGESRAKYQFPVECMIIVEWGASAKELTQLLAYFPKLSVLTVWASEKITGLGVAEEQATATPVPLPLANKAEDAQIEQHQQQDGATAEEEIAAEGLLLLPSQLQNLRIRKCPELILRSSRADSNTEAGRTGEGQGLQGLRSLRSLEVEACPRFLSSYSSSSSTPCFPFPSSLEDLSLDGVVGMETLLPLSNLTSLIDLSIWDCGDLRGEGLRPLLAQGRLTKLTVCRTPKFFAGSEPLLPHEQEFPSSSSKLQELRTDDVAGVLAAPIPALISSSLTELHFWEDKEVDCFTKGQEEALQLFTSLERIGFWDCDKLQCLPTGLHRLPNLMRLEIDTCAAALPKDGLPGSLQELAIDDCPGIRSLPKNCLPEPDLLKGLLQIVHSSGLLILVVSVHGFELLNMNISGFVSHPI